MWAYEQLHFSEQLVYKEYLNKMQFEVARMQFEAILYEVQFCMKCNFARLKCNFAVYVGWSDAVGGCDNM